MFSLKSHVRFPGKHAVYYASEQRGMGLADILVGLFLITIGILGLCSLGVSTIRGNLTARHFDQATRLAEQKLEAVRKGGYASATPGPTPVTEPNLDYAGNTPDGGVTAGGIFTRATTITTGSLPLTCNVTVTVSWTDQSAQGVSFSTILQGAF
jgi:Tfp pilus assembly protein PilV